MSDLRSAIKINSSSQTHTPVKEQVLEIKVEKTEEKEDDYEICKKIVEKEIQIQKILENMTIAGKKDDTAKYLKAEFLPKKLESAVFPKPSEVPGRNVSGAAFPHTNDFEGGYRHSPRKFVDAIHTNIRFVFPRGKTKKAKVAKKSKRVKSIKRK